MLDARLSTAALKAAGPTMAVLTIASVEQHGAHLPVGTDWIIGQALSKLVAGQLGAYCLPVMPFGTAREHGGNVGTVYVEPATLMAALTDLCLSLRDQGIRKICVLQTHGGNWVVKPAVRDLNLKYPDLTVVWADPFRIGAAALREICPSAAQEVHAGEMETSLMLHIDPEAVDMPSAVDFVPDATQEYLDYIPATTLCPHGVWGRPTLASAEKGERCLAALVRDSVRYFAETHQRLASLRP